MRAQRTRILTFALLFAIMVSVIPVASGPMDATAGGWPGGGVTVFGDVLYNGGFEQGFMANDACGGMVGKGWGCFHNSGTAAYGFYDDMWEAVVYAGEHSQLVEINTRQAGGDANRNAGIFQTVSVWPYYEYEFSIKGMIRAEDHGGDPWRYRVYVGFDYQGGNDWTAVTDWREMPWDTYYDRLNPGSFSDYSTKVTPTSDRLTVFVRVQRKWGTWYEETDFNLDAISLYGPVEVQSDSSQEQKAASDGTTATVEPASGEEAGTSEPVCSGPNLLSNGGFEEGFQANGVASSWTGFNNGGHANYGYYDEMWPPVVSEGQHGQLIEINTLDVGDTTEPNRISGIYQKVWLQPGATYELSLDAMMRERADHSDEDFYRYMVEWGYSKDGGTDPAKMDFWERVPLDNITLRTAPGDMQSYSTRFTAPSETTTIWIFAIKKWATLERELDVNIDNVVLRQCETPPPPTGIDMQKYVSVDNKATWFDADEAPGPETWVGDTVYFKFLVTNVGDTALTDIVLTDDGYILYDCPVLDPLMPGEYFTCVTGPFTAAYGQQVDEGAVSGYYGGYIYSDADLAYYYAVQPTEKPSKCGEPGDVWYVVQPGDTLGALAAAYGTTVEAIMVKNNIGDPNWIYVGQVLCIPDPPGATGYVPAAAPQPAPASSPSPPPTAVVAPSNDSEAPTTPSAPAETSTTSYRIQRGDTLSGIAARFNTSVAALMALNNIANANWIYAGQLLQIPAG